MRIFPYNVFVTVVTSVINVTDHASWTSLAYGYARRRFDPTDACCTSCAGTAFANAYS